MALPKRLLSLPLALAAYALGHWGIAQGEGLIGSVLPFLWVAAYYGIFWGGWFFIPLLGVGATFLQPLLPERLKRPVRTWFVGWLLAWFGVLLGILWLGRPPGFEQAPI